MYEEYVQDLKTIQSYEAMLAKHGSDYCAERLEDFRSYNQAKYRLSVEGLKEYYGS